MATMTGRYRNWSEQSDRNKISPGKEKRTNREGRTPPKGNFSQSRSPSKEKTMTRDSRKNEQGEKIEVSKDKDILNLQREQGKKTREDKKEV